MHNINIDYQVNNAADNSMWELLERELLDNVDPENKQYSSWWHHCDLINIFEFGVQQTLANYMPTTGNFSNRTSIYYY